MPATTHQCEARWTLKLPVAATHLANSIDNSAVADSQLLHTAVAKFGHEEVRAVRREARWQTQARSLADTL